MANDVWLRDVRPAASSPSGHRRATESRLRAARYGININLAADDIPPDLRDKATSMRIATGHACDRIAIADSLFNLLDLRYMETLTRGFDAVRPAWSASRR